MNLPRPLEQMQEEARRDDWHLIFVGSDIRQLISELARLQGILGDVWALPCVHIDYECLTEGDDELTLDAQETVAVYERLKEAAEAAREQKCDGCGKIIATDYEGIISQTGDGPAQLLCMQCQEQA